MNYEQVEEDIRARLHNAIGSTCKVIAIPETEEEFKRPITKPQITVSYNGSDFGTMGRMDKAEIRTLGDAITHREVLSFHVMLQSKKLRGEVGLYKIISDTLRLLTGYAPFECDRLYVTKFGFVDYKEGIWSYNLQMAATSILVQEQDFPDTPTFSNILLQSEFGQSEQ